MGQAVEHPPMERTSGDDERERPDDPSKGLTMTAHSVTPAAVMASSTPSESRSREVA